MLLKFFKLQLHMQPQYTQQELMFLHTYFMQENRS